MRQILFAMLALIPLTVGCNNLSPRDNLSPRLDQNLNNENARINGLENNMNSLKLELGRISNELSFTNSNVREMQQGWVNIQGQLSRNENSGIQVLQGDGALFLVFATVTLGMLFYFMFQTDRYKKTAEFFATQIKQSEDQELHERVLTAAWNTKLEKDVFTMTS